MRSSALIPPEKAAQSKRLADQLPRWFVTPHAVRRFIERVEPRCSAGRAQAVLVAMLRGAHFVKTRANGQELWKGPKPRRLRLLVSRQGNVMVLESVLFAFDR